MVGCLCVHATQPRPCKASLLLSREASLVREQQKQIREAKKLTSSVPPAPEISMQSGKKSVAP